MIRIRNTLPMALVMGSIFLLSHQPGDHLRLDLFSGLDKVAHVIAYGVLAVTAFIALPERLRSSAPLRSALLVWAVCLLFGLSDEFHQLFVPGREASLGDLFADAFGAAVVCVLWLVRERLPVRLRRPLPLKVRSVEERARE